MTREIKGLIVQVAVSEESQGTKPVVVQKVNENMKRPDVLPGATYQLKTPLSDSPFYITINDIVLNAGTDYEARQPFEIFINGKNVQHFQWTVAFTRLCSAVFRKGGDITFLLEELKSVYDPNGGYLSKNGWVPSLVAEIGMVIERHFIAIGLMVDPKNDKAPELTKEIAAKKEQFLSEGGNLENAEVCKTCHQKAYIHVSGCGICTNCGQSTCG
jgi:hypothetical protein